MLQTLFGLLAVFVSAFSAPLLNASQDAAPTDRKIAVLIIGGANNHWWQWTHQSLIEMLNESDKFDVTLTTEPAKFLADREGLERYQVFVLDYNGPRWGAAAEKNFLDAVNGGTGVSIIHAANNAFPGWQPYEELSALCWREGTGHGNFHRFDVKITDREHPITRNLPDLIAHPDELYHRLVHMHNTEYRVLATAHSSKESGGSGADEPMILVKNIGQGRIFHTPLGHVWTNVEATKASLQDPQLRELIVRGTEWAATGKVTPKRHPNRLTAAEKNVGWESLFNGRDAEHWRGYGKEGFPTKGWTVKDGALSSSQGGGGGDLITRKQYKDFEFAFEWKVTAGANSGVMYRVAETESPSYFTGPEYQVLDDTAHHGGENTATASAALYAMAKAEPKTLAPVGQWNTGLISIVNNHVEHWLNGIRVVRYELHSEQWKAWVAGSKFKAWPDFGQMEEGHVCLQDHGNAVSFRALRVRDLTK